MQHPALGIVILEGVLSVEQQTALIDIVRRFGGLKDLEDNWNFFGMRGRAFKRLDRYSEADREILRAIIDRFRELTEREDETLRYPPSTHLLTLWYPTSRGIGWHRDDNDRVKGGNNGDDDAPVYSLTLGNTCNFEYIIEGDPAEEVRSATLTSGTMIVFGGSQRLMRHRVQQVFEGTSPLLDARINLTFRTCTNFDSDEEAKFQTEAYVKRLKAKTPR